MGHPVINKGNGTITLKGTTVNTYKKLIALAETVDVKMTAAIATYATPVPTLASLVILNTALKAAAQPQGQKRNRGSKVQTLSAQAAANDVRVALEQLLQYAVNTALTAFPADSHQFNATLATSGFSMKNVRKLKHPGQPRFVRQDNSSKRPFAMMSLNWRRPLGLIKGAPIAGYLIKAANSFTHLQTAGYQDIDYDPAFIDGAATMLIGAGIYGFNVSIDGGANQPITFSGASAPKMFDVVTQINAVLVGGTCIPLDASNPNSHFRIQSNSRGIASSVAITPISGGPQYLWPALPNFVEVAAAVAGTDTVVPVSTTIIATVTKTNWQYNPSMKPLPNLSGQIVPFSARGEGNPINFTLKYVM